MLGIPSLPNVNSVIVELTQKCNNRCLVCGGAFANGNGELKFDTLQNLSDSLRSLTSVRLSGGEPLLYPKIIESIKLFTQRNCLVAMSSNGILLTDEIIGELTDAGLAELQISLDGASNTMIRRMRPNTNPESVKKQIGYFVEYSRKVRNTPIFICLTFCITRLNVQEIEDFVKLGQELGVAEVRFQRYNPRGTAIEQLSSEENRRIVNLISNLSQNRAYQPRIYLDSRFSGRASTFPFIRTHCIFPFMMMNISADGNVFPCCGTGGYDLPLGNLNKQTAYAIQQGELRQKLLRKLCSGTPPEACKGCPLLRKSNKKI